jgi:hypothetical protein
MVDKSNQRGWPNAPWFAWIGQSGSSVVAPERRWVMETILPADPNTELLGTGSMRSRGDWDRVALTIVLVAVARPSGPVERRLK